MTNVTFWFEHLECQAVNSLNDSASQCLFTQQRDDCFDEEGWIDYPFLFFCQLGALSRLLPILVSSILLAIYFLALGMTAEDFMCPSLASISKTLHLSENIAGVTFLALGNGAPDIFSSIAGIRQSRPELVIGELFGGGIFVTTIVVGIILMSGEFKVMERPIIRDVFFYASACFLTWTICFQGSIYLWESIFVLIIYVVYIGVVIVGRIIYMKRLTSADSTVTMTCSSTTELQWCDQSRLRTESNLSGRRYSANKIIKAERTRSRGSLSFGPSDLLPLQEIQLLKTAKKDRFREFLRQIDPLNWSELKYEPRRNIFLALIKSPIRIILTLTVPVIDPDDNLKSWSQILNCFHVISGPMVLAISAGALRCSIKGFPCLALVAIVCSLVAVTVFLTSKPDCPPIYYTAFSLLAFVVSCCWTYSIASEVVALLETLGFLFNISEAILGLTVLAWGNSLGDLIANVSLARHGFQRMAISACFGGPLLNLLLGIGIPYTIALPEKEGFVLKVQYTSMFTLLISVLMLGLGFTVAMFLFTGFRSNRYHGSALILVYLIYLIIAFVMELKGF